MSVTSLPTDLAAATTVVGTLGGGSVAEGNLNAQLAGATLTLSLTKAFDIPTVWSVGYSNGSNATVNVTSRELTSGVATACTHE